MLKPNMKIRFQNFAFKFNLSRYSLETRKGVITFCDAIEKLLAGESGEPSLLTQDAVLEKLKQVTFLGRGAMVHGKFGVHYVQERQGLTLVHVIAPLEQHQDTFTS